MSIKDICLSFECLCQVCVGGARPELRTNLALGFVHDAEFSKCKGGRLGDRILTAVDVLAKETELINQTHLIKLVSKCMKTCNKLNRQSFMYQVLQLWLMCSLSHAQERSGELGWVPLMSGRWCRWPLQVLIVGHPERNWAPLEWSSLSSVHHDLLELLPNLDHVISQWWFFLQTSFNIENLDWWYGERSWN